MQEFCNYQIEVRGQVDEGDLNAMSPLQMQTAHVNVARSTTVFTIHADQSGLIGLLRHLHARGLVFLSIHMERSSD